MLTPEMHKAQVSILRTLRHTPSARYTDLLQPTGMESDVFKFHLRKLIHLRYVVKTDAGLYELTPTGKEFANNLSKQQRTVQKQPKLSMAIIVSRPSGSTTEYLVQQRLRHPYYGFWGCLSGPVQWGETIEASAQRELQKQTGLSATCVVRAFYRKSDYDASSEALLEDKLFVIVEARTAQGSLSNTWPRGLNAWMTLAKLKRQPKYFSSTCEFIEMLETGTPYAARKYFYSSGEY